MNTYKINDSDWIIYVIDPYNKKGLYSWKYSNFGMLSKEYKDRFNKTYGHNNYNYISIEKDQIDICLELVIKNTINSTNYYKLMYILNKAEKRPYLPLLMYNDCLYHLGIENRKYGPSNGLNGILGYEAKKIVAFDYLMHILQGVSLPKDIPMISLYDEKKNQKYHEYVESILHRNKKKEQMDNTKRMIVLNKYNLNKRQIESGDRYLIIFNNAKENIPYDFREFLNIKYVDIYNPFCATQKILLINKEYYVIAEGFSEYRENLINNNILSTSDLSTWKSVKLNYDTKDGEAEQYFYIDETITKKRVLEYANSTAPYIKYRLSKREYCIPYKKYLVGYTEFNSKFANGHKFDTTRIIWARSNIECLRKFRSKYPQFNAKKTEEHITQGVSIIKELKEKSYEDRFKRKIKPFIMPEEVKKEKRDKAYNIPLPLIGETPPKDTRKLCILNKKTGGVYRGLASKCHEYVEKGDYILCPEWMFFKMKYEYINNKSIIITPAIKNEKTGEYEIPFKSNITKSHNGKPMGERRQKRQERQELVNAKARVNQNGVLLKITKQEIKNKNGKVTKVLWIKNTYSPQPISLDIRKKQSKEDKIKYQQKVKKRMDDFLSMPHGTAGDKTLHDVKQNKNPKRNKTNREFSFELLQGVLVTGILSVKAWSEQYAKDKANKFVAVQLKNRSLTTDKVAKNFPITLSTKMIERVSDWTKQRTLQSYNDPIGRPIYYI